MYTFSAAIVRGISNRDRRVSLGDRLSMKLYSPTTFTRLRRSMLALRGSQELISLVSEFSLEFSSPGRTEQVREPCAM